MSKEGGAVKKTIKNLKDMLYYNKLKNPEAGHPTCGRTEKCAVNAVMILRKGSTS